RADILQASKIRPKKREEWIQSNRADVLITHPKTVSTGLDLVDFPEVVWYQQDYSIYILRQASRRSWRIGQTKPVNVHYLFYKNSIQDKAIKLNIQKLRAALLTEGDLVDEGLVTQAEDDGLVSLAKAIISHTDEKASLKSELARLCALGDQSDFILPEQGSPQELQVEKSEPNAEWPSQPENAQPIEPAPLPQLPPQIKKPAVKSRRGTVDPNQLALFYFREAAG
ncbi:MAG: hypothetical protein GTO40_13285, partial [Deltaproteobacteria bacterium]|nr:hypothetical protein [Deltaproteobacteria bacterium]